MIIERYIASCDYIAPTMLHDHIIYKSKTAYKSVLKINNITFPSANPITKSFDLSFGHVIHETLDVIGNLLQIDFLSPHSVPIL